MAEDVTQDAFVEMLSRTDLETQLMKCDEEQLGLLRKIAVRRGLDAMRRQRNLRTILGMRIGWMRHNLQADAAAEIAILEAVRAIREIRDPRHRAIAVLTWLCECKPEEIAAHVGLSESRVRTITGDLRNRFRPRFMGLEPKDAPPQEGMA